MRCTYSWLGRALAALGLVLIANTPAAADEAARVVPESRAQVQLSYAPLVKQAAPAVVNIYARRLVRSRPFFDDPFFRRFFGEESPFGAPRERLDNSLGSGVIVSPDGLILTNHHVIDRAQEIIVALADRREFAATVVTADARTDLAVLRVDTGGAALPYLELMDSADLEVGDIVLAIGNPFGVGQTVTSGIVSALARTQVGVTDYSFFIQTDAAINPGNSGGALVTLDGRLAGVNTAIFSRSGGSIGIGFAIPANMARVVIAGAAAGGRFVRAWLGASGQEVTADMAQALGLERPGGVIVNAIYPGGPADSAGLRIGDVVIAVAGREVADPKALQFRVATRPLGSDLAIAYWREGRAAEAHATLRAPPEEPPRDTATLSGRHPLAGAVVANLSPALADELGISTMARGVIVLNVSARSPARRLRLRSGDVIATVNGREIERVANLVEALSEPRERWRIAVRRGERLIEVTVRG